MPQSAPNLPKCMPEPFQKRIRKQTPLQKGPNPETAYSCTLWHDFPVPKPPQKPPKTLPKITKTSPRASPEGTCKTVCNKVIPFSQNYPKSDSGGTPNGSQNPSKITLLSIGDPQLQPTGPRDAQEGVHHPNWSQKSSKNDPRTLKSRPKILSEKPTACQKKGRRQWA